MTVSYDSIVAHLSSKQHKETPKERIEIHIVQSHCCNNVNETVILSLPIDSSGEKTLNLFIQIFSEVSYISAIYREISTDEIAEKIVKKYNTDYNLTFNLLNSFIRSDGSYDNILAHPESYQIKVFDDLGNSTVFVTQH